MCNLSRRSRSSPRPPAFCVRVISMFTELPANTCALPSSRVSSFDQGAGSIRQPMQQSRSSTPSLRPQNERREASFACSPRSGFTTLGRRTHLKSGWQSAKKIDGRVRTNLGCVSFASPNDRSSFGRKTHSVEGIPTQVYSVAKTVADCFKYRNKIGLDVALEALRESIRSRKATNADLWQAAKVCRVANVMRPYLEALT